MSLSLPGKVMVIDDKFESIKDVIDSLTKSGTPVLFWNGKGNPPESTFGVRIVLLDLNLEGAEYDSDFMYYDTAKVISLLSGPYIVLIVSVNYTADAPAKIEEAYKNVNDGKEIPGLVIPEGFTKDDAKEISKVLNALKNILIRNQVFHSILLAEETLDRARDTILSDFARKSFQPTVRILIESVEKDIGKSSLARELIVLLAHLQTQNISKIPTYHKFKDIVEKLPPLIGYQGTSSFGTEIQHKRMFYSPEDSERPWTGDIYKTRLRKDNRKYAIIITPACDIAQGKASYLKLCYGFLITETNLEDKTCPIYRLDMKVKKVKDAKDKYLKERLMPERFHSLDNFLDNKYFKLLFDFQAVESITLEDFSERKWKRICRLDTPYIENLLQKYGAYAFRLGTPITKLKEG